MERFKEASTYAGIAGTLAAISPFLSFNPTLNWVVSGIAGLAGGLAIWIRDRPAK